MARVTLLTGGNLGDRERNLQQAAQLIGRQIGPVVLSSAVYESEPWGFEAEELFLNQALVAETGLAPMAVLERIQAIERSMGRDRGEDAARNDSTKGNNPMNGAHGTAANAVETTPATIPATPARTYHSRTIDIDILFYDDIRLSTPRLTIPHPRIAERGFVLRPLSEIIPDYIHPATRQSIRSMWQQFCRKNDQQ